MAVSKVILNGNTLMDVTVDTVTSEKLLSGFQATGRDGQKIQGSYVPASVSLAVGSADPSEDAQHITPPSGYDGFSYFDVGAIDSNYVGSNVAQRSGSDLSASGSIITVPSGYYSSEATKAVSAGSATTPTKTISVTPSISINTSTGMITATAAGSSSISPTVSAGYITTGTAGTVSVTGSNTSALSTQGATTINPTESEQIAVAANKYTTGTVKVAAIPSDYIGSAIASVDIVEGTTTVSGSTVTRGIATWSAGVIPSGQMNAATFANSSTAQTQYVDISETTDAPVLVSGGYLYINKGYTDDLKISLAKLVPDGASADLASDKILSGYAAYNNDGTLIAGNIPSKSSIDVTASGSTVSVPSGYYASAVDKNVASGSVKVNNTDLVRTPGLTLDNTVGIVTATIPYAQTNVGAALSTGYISTVATGSIGVTGSSSLQLSVVSGSTITPTESTQVAVASGSYTLGDVKIAAISSDYVGSNIAQRSSSDLSATGSVVTVPSGYYASAANTNIKKGQINITNQYVGPEVGTVILDTTNGIVNISRPKYDYTITAKGGTTGGYVDSTVTATGSFTFAANSTSYQLDTIAAATITPTESSQVAAASGKYTLGDITVAAISSDYIGSNIAQRSSSDLSASGSIITVPSGYYATEVAQAVVAGALKTAPIEIPLMPTFSIDSNGLVTARQSTTTQFSPIFTPGYIDSGYMNASVASSSTYQLTTASASTYTPSSATQSIPSGVYLTGVQTIAGDTNLIAGNIAEGVTIFGITGTHHGGPSIWRLVAQETLVYLDYASVNKKILTTAGSVKGTNLIL